MALLATVLVALPATAAASQAPTIDCAGVVATTLPATDVTSSGAVLNGTVYGPCMSDGQGYFQFGTASPSNDVFPTSQSPDGRSGWTYSASVTGLAPGTTYQFRMVGTNLLSCRPTAGGSGCNTSYGADVTFTTAPVPPVLSLAVSRAHVTRRFRAEIRVKCPTGAASPCQGTIALTKHRHVLARARFVVQPGTKQTLTVKLDRPGRKLMRRHRRLRIQLLVQGASRSLLLVRG